MEEKNGRTRKCLRRTCGPSIAAAALLTTLATAWYRISSNKGLPPYSMVDLPSAAVSGDEVVLVRRHGPLAHTSVLREDTLAFLRNRHRTSTHGDHYTIRLPRTLLPEHYDLEIKALFAASPTSGHDVSRLDNDAYEASVAIRVRCVESTSTVVLHAGKFNFTQEGAVGHPAALVWPSENPTNTISVNEMKRVDDTKFLVLTLSDTLKKGNVYVVKLNYSARLGDARGFYKYHYNNQGRPEHLVVTFFEPTFAREAFPCFDEPDLKATFNVVVVRPKGYTSISTMPLERSEDRPGDFVADHFMTTFKMSTYTLAFMISNYTATRNGKVSIWTRPEDATYANYSAQITPRIMKFFEALFDVPYSLPKIDLTALPSFMVDAMENWGLLTFHKNSLLLNPTSPMPLQKIIVATVVSHELAHQWFGNLVTMSWWNDVWLNEGFASYMQYLGVNTIHPEWNMLDQFTMTDMHPIMKAEYATESHALSVEGNFSTELDSLFDRIVYNKGPSLVRMMSYFLTPPVFYKGIRAYLKKYSFGNAAQDQLFAELTQAQTPGLSAVDVKQVMDTWTKQPGYPVVEAMRNYSDGTASLLQRHHCVKPDLQRTWHIPITYTDSETRNFTYTDSVLWMKTKEATLKNMPGKEHWIILNILCAGYYRVNYDRTNWELLRVQLLSDPRAIPVLNRAQLLQDASDLAHAGDLSFEVAMGIMDYIKGEKDFVPIKTLLTNVEELDAHLRATDFYGKWQLYMSRQLKEHFDTLTWLEKPEEALSKKLLRKDIVFWSCQFNYEPCVNQCVERFKAFLNNSASLKSALSQDLAGTMVTLCHAIRVGDSVDWRFLMDHIRDAETVDQGHVIVSALGCSKDTKNLQRLLAITMKNITTLNEKMGDSVSYFFESVMFSTKGGELALEFLVDNWKSLFEKYGQGSSLKDTVWYALQAIRRSDELNRMEHFYSEKVKTTKNAKKLVRTFESALDVARANMKWVTTNGRVIERWLDRKLLELM